MAIEFDPAIAHEMIDVFIADDHQVLIDGLLSLLSGEPGIRVVGTAKNGKDLLEQLQTVAVNVVLLDLDMPEMDGFETCKQLKKLHPDIKPVVLTMYENAKYIQSLMQLGAKGYLFKNAEIDEVVDAIKKVHGGDTYITPSAHELLMKTLVSDKSPRKPSALPRITRREKEILRLIVDEFTTQEIADSLFISVNTVESHRKNLMVKLDAKNSAGLVRVAFEKGLLSDETG